MSPYEALGLPKNSTEAEVTKAYRKLRSKHHPDRGGDRTEFEKVEQAYQNLKSHGFKIPEATRVPPNQGFGTGFGHRTNTDNIHDIFRDFQDIRNKNAETGIFQRDAPIKDIFNGWYKVMLGNEVVELPKGTPHGFQKKYGAKVLIFNLLMPKGYRIRGMANEKMGDAGVNIGDVEIDIELNAIELITGTWIIVTSFNGEQVKVRIPAGHNPKTRLKIANMGYWAWLKEYNKPSERRADMYVKITPVFTAPHAIPREKIEPLLNLYARNAPT